MSRSADLWAQARRVMPGGVSSPARAYTPHPLFLQRGSGTHVWDADEKEYIDWCLAFGPLILGHAHPRVVEAATQALRDGSLLGAPCETELRLAETVRERMPNIERLRFVSTGTEASMHALRLARAATGRTRIVKVHGGFHGSHDAVLVRAGSAAETHGAPDSDGVPDAVARDTTVVPFNDPDAVARTCRGRDVAAILIEPVLANVGTVPPEPDYLPHLREIADETDTLLVFDEIVTGFRIAPGGAQQRYAVRPDLTCLGKVLGGGLPLAAYGGPSDLMARIAPEGRVFQAGTYSGNPVSCAAGLATLQALDGAAYEQLEETGRKLGEGMAEAAAPASVPLRIQRVGSILSPFFTDTPVRRHAPEQTPDALRLYAVLMHTLHRRGVYPPPSPFESWFASTAHRPQNIDATTHALREGFATCTSA